jgi:hypothetical protein
MKLDDIPQDIEPKVGDILEIEQGDVCFEVRIIGITADGYLCEQDNVQGAVLLEGVDLDHSDVSDIAGYIAEEKVRLDPKCWKGKKIGNPKTKMKGGVRVNNCVPESVSEGSVTKKPQPYNDPNWIKNLPKEKLDALAGPRYKKDNKDNKDKKNVEEAAQGNLQANYKNYSTPDLLRMIKTIKRDEIGIKIIKAISSELIRRKDNVEEAGPFRSTEPKKPRRGSVADLAARKRAEQDRTPQRQKEIDAIGNKNHHVGTARVRHDESGVEEGSDLPPRVIEMIKKIAQSSASPEHKKAAIDALVAKYSKKGVAEAKPGWMLKQDTKLGAKVKAKTDLAKKRQAAYGDPSAGKSVEKNKEQGVAEGYTGRETKDGTWRVFKDGKAVAAAGPFKSREEAAAWIKKQKQGVAEGRHFRTAYGYAGGYNEKTGGKYKHPEDIRADREAKQKAKDKEQAEKKPQQAVKEGPEEHEYSLSMGNRQRPGSDRLDTDPMSRIDRMQAQDAELKQKYIEKLVQRGWERSDLELARLPELINMLRMPGPEGVKEAEYQGRKVQLGKKMAGDVKKSKVYVRKPNGKVVKVNFGDKNMTIKKSNPARRKSFRARHNCDNPGPRWKARYWSCKSW